MTGAARRAADPPHPPVDPTGASCDLPGRPGCSRPAPRLLVVPGLHDSDGAHWQSWLERRVRGGRRLALDDWSRADLDAWAEALAATLRDEPAGPWIAVAHSFGSLALAEHLLRGAAAAPGADIVAALLVAPADPRRFGVAQRLARRLPPVPATVVASHDDPWLPTHEALAWAHAWGTRLIDLGAAGHVNTAAGFGAWPWVRQWVERQRQRWLGEQRREREAEALQHAAATLGGRAA